MSSEQSHLTVTNLTDGSATLGSFTRIWTHGHKCVCNWHPDLIGTQNARAVDGFNVSSVDDNGVSLFDVNMTLPLQSSTQGSAHGCAADNNPAGAGRGGLQAFTAFTTLGFRSRNTSAGGSDFEDNWCVINGNVA